MSVPSQDHLQTIADEFAEDLGLAEEMEPYAHLRWRAEAIEWPALHLEDLTAIPFLSRIAGIEAYQHRARVRARATDLFAAVGPTTDGYEDYCRDVLGLGSPELVQADPVDGPMAVALACAEGTAHDRLVERAKAIGAFALHPYMSIEAVWELADKIGVDAGVPVAVCGPPPPVLWIANDKSLLTDLAGRAAGTDIIIESRLSDEPAELAAALIELGANHRRVGIKRTRCASAMGNRVFESSALGAQEQVEADVRHFLEDTEWEPGEPVIATVWEEASSSPSTQLWLPPIGVAPVRIDGIYEQILEGEEQVFVGSRPSTLPAAVEDALTNASLAVGGALQCLGYTGRCSFDFLVLGDPQGRFQVKLTECNGRWGGTSTPMHIVDRLVAGPRPCYQAQDFMRSELAGLPFSELLARVGDDLYDPKQGTGRFVFYNVGCLAPSGKFDVIAFGRTPDDAAEAAQRILPDRLGVCR